MNALPPLLRLAACGLAFLGCSSGQTVQILKDINTQPWEGPSYPAQYRTIGNTTYFTATTPLHGKELWKTDGTETGTTLVKDIRPGIMSSNPGAVTGELNGVLLFFCDDGIHGVELWRSDGTEEGTYLLRDIQQGPGPTYSSASSITTIGNHAYFSADDGIFGAELWRTDGTIEGTHMVRDILPGPSPSSPDLLVALGDTLCFIANHPSAGREIWRSDGTAGGTTLLRDIRVGSGSSHPDQLTAVGGTLFFGASETTGRNLWKSDGTTAGTVLVRDIDPNSTANNTLQSLTAVGSLLYFYGNTVTHGWELWRSNGTGAGTNMVADLRPGNTGGVSLSSLIHPLGNQVIFHATNGTTNTGLWISNGTSAGTSFLGGPLSSSGLSNRGAMLGGNLYLLADSQIWRTNGTAAGTSSLFESSLSATSSLALLGNSLILGASQPGGLVGELWKSNGNPGNFELLQNIYTRTASSGPGGFIVAGNRMFFNANDGIHGPELWTSDGTEAGTTMVREIGPGSGFSINIYTSLAVGDSIYFPANDGTSGTELWKSDGTAAGTSRVADIREGPDSSLTTNFADGHAFGSLGDLVFFRAEDGIHGLELWVTDGTEAGTRLLKDLLPGTNSSVPGNHLGVVMDGIFYFDAATVTHGRELWRSDGTSEGTYMVADILTGPGNGFSNGSRRPLALVHNGALFFSAVDGADGYRKLWKSDGTAAGTQRLGNVRVGYDSFETHWGMLQAVAFQDGFCFLGWSPSTGAELWFSDGTEAGTRLVADLTPGTESSVPRNGVVMGSSYYFITNHAGANTVLWRWDGGASLPFQITATPGAPNPLGISQLLAHAGNLYFSAFDSGGTNHLWTSDGTSAGTVRIPEPFEGQSPAPEELVALGNKIFFRARFSHISDEPAFYTTPSPEIEISQPPGNPLASSGSLLDYGSWPVSAGQAAVRTFRITNTGNASLHSLQFQITGDHTADFLLPDSGLPASLEPGTHADFELAFRPTTEGPRNATLEITGIQGLTAQVALTGTGAPPPIFTWSGLGGDDRWSTAENWQGGVAPPNDGSARLIFPDSPRPNPEVDVPWHVQGMELTYNASILPVFRGETLSIGRGGIVESGQEIRLVLLDLNVVLTDDQTWLATGANKNLPRLSEGRSLETNGHELTLGSGAGESVLHQGSLDGAGSLRIAPGSYAVINGSIRLGAGILLQNNATLSMSDISYPGGIHGENASMLIFSETASGVFLPRVTGTFGQLQIYDSLPSKTLSFPEPVTPEALTFSAIGSIRLQVADDLAFGPAGHFNLGGVTGPGPVLESIGGPRILPKRLYNQYASDLTIAGPEWITFTGGASLGGYPGATATLRIDHPDGRLRLESPCFGQHAFPIDKTGPGALEFAGTGNNQLTFPLHVKDGSLILNKPNQTGGVTAFSGNLRIGNGINPAELLLLNSNQIADSASVVLDPGGVFNLNGSNESIATLEGGGTVGNGSATGSATLTVLVPAGQSSSFSGSLVDRLGSGSRSLGFRMAGHGTMILSGANPLSTVSVEAGELRVLGSIGSPGSSTFILGNGMLSGSGHIGGQLTFSGSNSAISPGPGIATLEINGDLDTPPGNPRSISLEIDRSLAVSDVLRVNGYVNLGQGLITLAWTDLHPQSTATAPVLLVENTSLQATEGFFAGLPEGAPVTIGGQNFLMTYAGGPGENDVFLLPVPGISDPALLVALRQVLGLAPDAAVTPADLAELTTLDLSSSGISDLSGLGAATHLQSLLLAGNHITDLSPLHPLTALLTLDLRGNPLDASSLAWLAGREAGGLIVPKSPQTLTWETPPPPWLDAGSQVPLAASSSSGLPVTIGVSDPAKASLSAGMLQVAADATGTITLQLRQAGNPLVLPAARDVVRFILPPAARTYTLAHRFIPPSPVPGGLFGIQISADDNILAVQSPRIAAADPNLPESDIQAIDVFSQSTSSHLRRHVRPGSMPAAALFGFSIATWDGNLLAGSPILSSFGGNAPALLYPAATPTAPLSLSPPQVASDYYGSSVAMNGSRMVIGATQTRIAGLRKGAAYLLDRNDGTTIANLGPDNTATHPGLGSMVALTAQHAIASAGEGSHTVLYVFSAETGAFQRKIQPAAGTANRLATNANRTFLAASQFGLVRLFSHDPSTGNLVAQSEPITGSIMSLAANEEFVAFGLLRDTYDSFGNYSENWRVEIRRVEDFSLVQILEPPPSLGSRHRFGAALTMTPGSLFIGAPHSAVEGPAGSVEDAGSVLEYKLTSQPKALALPDETLAHTLRSSLQLAPGEALTDAALATLTRLDLSGLPIHSLAGLEFATQLRSLDLRGIPAHDPHALWDVLDRMDLPWLLVDSPRPDAPPQGRISRRFVSAGGAAFHVILDPLRQQTLDVSSLNADLSNPDNQAALADIAALGVEIIGLGYSSWPVLAALPPDKRGPLDRNGPLQIENLLAYAMGLDPLAATAADLPRVTTVNPSAGHATFRYRRAKNATGASLAPMTSTHFAPWQPAPILQTTVLQDGGDWEIIEIRVATPPDGKLFFRLQASETP